jgi:hypothetical protein
MRKAELARLRSGMAFPNLYSREAILRMIYQFGKPVALLYVVGVRDVEYEVRFANDHASQPATAAL